ncbi:hypothetical protein CAPTEDRAFT_130381 [Capitella teleta]|uniref:HSF-type DNA-binding domain-containing protein n=1 Tax=Capitella teleta TaxID=283909 RepID=R7TQC3_CAPTE|nr:hypothetical protein CAPTEDRAFT_130381 [Capitella teleta]|eukprot:ELT96118.1 hypothetical protein CAPTEDRAFT_130381 [Capitella teleta]
MTVPAFITKLWTLVEDFSTDELIAWDSTGLSFHVLDQGRFAKDVLPLYFKHNNIASFIRQLNMYGFRKILNIEQGSLKSERDDMEFAHQFFQRDREDLLEFIKRKVSHGKAGEVDVKVRPDTFHTVLNEVHDVQDKQDQLTTSLSSLKCENEALWREVASLRQKHHKQQQIVNKLIQFLVSLVGSKHAMAGMKRKRPLMLNDASQLETSQAKIPKTSEFTFDQV